jgi:hypothetical protein
MKEGGKIVFGSAQMPELCRFFGIVIAMYYDDHAPPHFHAIAELLEAWDRRATGKKPPRIEPLQ